jgi:hypothetical protein
MIFNNLLHSIESVPNFQTGLIIGLRVFSYKQENPLDVKYEIVSYKQLKPYTLREVTNFLENNTKITHYFIYNSLMQIDINKAIDKLESLSKDEEGRCVLF